ncbi:MAG: DNA ligase (NAD(+)) LigA [Candidatus Riflebacteria bacterium HGW-Riflebacteria-1]|jgi:DNA ligase (NAD+)|nr:MAG: DNA ligase (NAD(+)) LigA [Candidatus Riflebacteria bacterium HGW-Riflebacteria-1]
MDPAARLEELRRIIRHHERQYFVLATPEISDRQFDELMAELQSIEKQHPELVTPDSPTQRVGEAVTSFNTVKHRVPMMSIENSYSTGDIVDWLNRLEKAAGTSVFPVVAELKIDGVSGSFTYRDGMLHSGTTRGNGIEGDVITENVRTIRSLPLSIASNLDIDVRGEIYTPRSMLETLNQQRVANGEEPFKNCRNLTAGTIKSLDPAVAAQRGLQVMVYGIAQAAELGFKMHSEVLAFLAKQGFKLNQAWQSCSSCEEISGFIEQIANSRGKFDFDIDGIVIKVDNLSLQAELGSTNKAPRWAIAYKYPQERATARLLRVEWQTGRSQLTPVAHIEPVELGGTTVARASLHNIDQITEKDIRLGDLVIVEKAGYIIPYIVAPVKEKRDGSEQTIAAPHVCPVCQQPVKIDKDENAATQIRCDNPACQGVLARRIIHFITQLEIENFGPQLVDQLIDKEQVQNVEDILKLGRLQLSALERMGEKSAEKIVSGISAAAQQPLAKLISALGINNVGVVVSEKIAAWYKQSFAAFLEAKDEELVKIDGIKDKVAGSITEFLRNPDNGQLIESLRGWWQGPGSAQLALMNAGSQLAGKTFVVTGEATLPRRQIEEQIKMHGGNVKSSVSPKTDFLLIGSLENDSFVSNKKSRAIELKIPIIDEFELARTLEKKIENGKFSN